MKKIPFILFLSGLMAMMSFTSGEPSKTLIIKAGTYGSCGYVDANNQTGKIELKLHEDHTFQYTNHIGPSKKVDIQGIWKAKGNNIRLESTDGGKSFHQSWRLDSNEKCIKSRKGLYFIRLCSLEDCK